MVPIDPAFRDAVRRKYSEIDHVWDDVDRWHAHSRKQILACVSMLSESHPDPYDTVIDIGAGGYPHNIPHIQYVQVDISFERLLGAACTVCADAHALPVRDRAADCILCVGPVVNYCSLVEVIAEASRIAKREADFLLHVELSNSLEFAFTKHFGADAAFVNTFYKGEEPLWVYSDRNVRRSLTNAGFTIRYSRYLHIVSGLAYRIFKNSNVAAKFAALDPILRYLPGVRMIADSALFICEKTA